MIQFLADNIDQLDLALDQLSINERNFDRFALLLVDNAVELLLHRFAEDKSVENYSWGKIGKPKYEPEKIKKALGRFFDDKAKFASQNGLMNSEVCTSIINLHNFRNTTYHKGMRHEGVLHSLTLFYLKNACDLHVVYRPHFWCWSSRDIISHRALKYLGQPDIIDAQSKFNEAFKRLKVVANAMSENLILDLSNDMKSTVSNIDDLIDFLANESPERKTRDEAVIDCQAWEFAFTDRAEEYLKTNRYMETNPFSRVEWLAKKYNWTIKRDPIKSWERRMEGISSQENSHNALRLYCDFMKETEQFRTTISNAAQLLDGHIQNEVDRLRGK